MADKGRNIYKTAREQAGLTQEVAAEALHISVKSIACYEAYQRYPDNDIANAMVVLYNNQFLAVQHLQLTAEGLSTPFLPLGIDIKDLPTSVLAFFKEFNELERCKNRLIEIAADGIVSEDEQADFDKILKEMDDVVRSIYTIKLSNSGRE